MAFKMKGPSLYPKMNTAIRLSQKLNVDHSANTSTNEGRAKSSAFQMKDDGKKKKTKEDYIKEGFTPADADKMMKDGATTGKQAEKPSQGDFEPAYPGADYSKKDIAKMSEKEKQSKIDGYTPKKKKLVAKKSTTTAHGQLDDAEYEYQQDKKMVAEMNKKKSKNK